MINIKEKDLGQVNIFIELSEGRAEYVAQYKIKDIQNQNANYCWTFPSVIYCLKHAIKDYKKNILCVGGELFADMNETKIVSVINIILKKLKRCTNLKINIVCRTYLQIYSVYLYSKLYDLDLKCFRVDKNEKVEECEDIKETIGSFYIPFNKLYYLELDLLYKGAI